MALQRALPPLAHQPPAVVPQLRGGRWRCTQRQAVCSGQRISAAPLGAPASSRSCSAQHARRCSAPARPHLVTPARAAPLDAGSMLLPRATTILLHGAGPRSTEAERRCFTRGVRPESEVSAPWVTHRLLSTLRLFDFEPATSRKAPDHAASMMNLPLALPRGSARGSGGCWRSMQPVQAAAAAQQAPCRRHARRRAAAIAPRCSSEAPTRPPASSTAAGSPASPAVAAAPAAAAPARVAAAAAAAALSLLAAAPPPAAALAPPPGVCFDADCAAAADAAFAAGISIPLVAAAALGAYVLRRPPQELIDNNTIFEDPATGEGRGPRAAPSFRPRLTLRARASTPELQLSRCPRSLLPTLCQPLQLCKEPTQYRNLFQQSYKSPRHALRGPRGRGSRGRQKQQARIQTHLIHALARRRRRARRACAHRRGKSGGHRAEVSGKSLAK